MGGMLAKTLSPAYMAYDEMKKDDKPAQAAAAPVMDEEDDMMKKRKRMGARKSAAGMLAEKESPKTATQMLSGE